MKKVTLNKKQKECLKSFIEHRQVARAAFAEASQMVRDTEKLLWEKMIEVCPNATRIECPPDGDWIIYMDKEQ